MASNWQTVQVNGQIPADVIVNEGDGTTLIANTDIVNPVWISDDQGMYSAQTNSIQLNPQSTIVVDGKTTLYALAAKNKIVAVNVVPGGMSFFQSTILGTGFLVTNAGFFFYNGTPGVGNLIADIVSPSTTHDPFGNPAVPVFFAGDSNSSFTQIDASGDLIVHSAAGNPVISISVNKLAMFFYTAAGIGLGNLVYSISLTGSGTDSAGNAYLPGATAYKKITSTDFQAFQSNAGGWNLWTAAAAGGPWNLVFTTGLQPDEVGFSLASNVNSGQIVLGETAAAIEVTPPASNLGLWVLGNGAIQTGQFILDGTTAQATPSQGVEFDFDSSHNLNITGDNVGGNNHILIFNYDLALRTAVVSSAPSTGWRIGWDGTNLVLNPAVNSLLELVKSGVWWHDTNGALAAPSVGVVTQLDSSGDRIEITDSNNVTNTFTSARLSSFPNNSVTNATPTNLTSVNISAGDARAGSTYIIECDGNWTQATGTALPFTIIGACASVGTQVTQTIGISGFNAGGTGRFTGWVKLTCVTPGVNGTWHMTVWLTWTPNANPNNTVVVCDGTITPFTMDSTVTQSLQLRANWSSNVGSPSATSRVATAYRIN